MTGVKLQHYLEKSGIFASDKAFMVEVLDGNIYNHVSTNYKCKIGYHYINISLYRKKGSEGLLISISHTHSFAYKNESETKPIKLTELTLPTLIKKLDTIFTSIPDINHLKAVERYVEWRLECLIEHRHNLIESIL